MLLKKLQILILLLLILPAPMLAQQEEFTLTGVYNGKNLFVQNPLSSNMKDYCAQEVWVNGSRVMSNPRSSAFTINLSNLAHNTPVVIRVVHKQGCVPKIINPQVIRTGTNFRFNSIHLGDNLFEWVTSGELESGKFFVERWENGKWSTVETLEAKGQPDSRYQLKVEHPQAENRYRIK